LAFAFVSASRSGSTRARSPIDPPSSSFSRNAAPASLIRSVASATASSSSAEEAENAAAASLISFVSAAILSDSTFASAIFATTSTSFFS